MSENKQFFKIKLEDFWKIIINKLNLHKINNNMNIKKYIIFGITGIALSVLWGFFVLNYNNTYYKGIIDQLPSNFSRIAYFNINNNFKSYIKKNNIPWINKEIQEILFSIKELALLDISWINENPLILVKAWKKFKLKKIKEMGLLKTWANNTYKKIWTNSYIYWKESLIENYKNHKNKLISNQKLKKYISSIKKGTSNIFVAWNMNRINKNNNSILNSMDFFVINSNMSAWKSFWNIDVLFNQDISKKLWISQNYKFDPKLWKFRQKSDIAFVEIGNIKEFLDIPKSLIIRWLKNISKRTFGEEFSSLREQDYENLYSIINSNIAIKISPSEKFPKISLELIFDDKSVYKTFHKIFLINKKTISKKMASISENFLGSKNNNIKFFDKENSFGSVFQLPYLQWMWNFQWTIEINRSNNSTFIKIFQTKNKTDNKTQKFDFGQKSLISFYLNIQNLHKTVKNYSKLFGINIFKDQNNIWFFENKIVYWNLVFQKSQISLKFNLFENEDR